MKHCKEMKRQRWQYRLYKRKPDGENWWYAFTSFNEEMKGADSVKSTFLVDIDKLFDAALTVPEIKGVILNPWNRTLMLDKGLIRIIKPE